MAMIETGSSDISVVALFSGGLDSILAARLVMEQGLRVRCLHFVTPFFGKPHLLEHWQDVYGLEIEALDIGQDYVDMLRQRPQHGFGKVMNPCVDCKVLMMRHARLRMEALGAQCIVSGEVLGQRPMSQRRDTLNVIRRDGGVREVLLRPLCAQHLDPTEAELSGLVDRSRLLGIFGRGRKDQMELAARMGITEIPTPAGGCKLAEKENARRYWPVLTRLPVPTPADFQLSNVGRQGWSDHLWMSSGRNEADNDALFQLARPGDVFMKVRDFPGPLALIRPLPEGPCMEAEGPCMEAEGPDMDAEWHDAAALLAACAPKAVRQGGEVAVRLFNPAGDTLRVLTVLPHRGDRFSEPPFDLVRDTIRAEGKEKEKRRLEHSKIEML